MAEDMENSTSPIEPVTSQETRKWVADAVAAAKGDNDALGRTTEELGRFNHYDVEVYQPILAGYIRALKDSSKNDLEFVKGVLGLSAVLFVAGYKEGRSKERGAEEIKNMVK